MLIRRGQLDLQLDRPPLPRLVTTDLSEEERRAAEEEQRKAEAERAAATMAAARRAAVGVVEGAGGYVESYSKQGGPRHHHHHHHHHRHQEGERLELTARVPSDGFDAAMSSLRELVLTPSVEGLAGSVLFESASTEDVTGQYIDAEVRPNHKTLSLFFSRQPLALLRSLCQRLAKAEDSASCGERGGRTKADACGAGCGCRRGCVRCAPPRSSCTC